jgi:hypothetical protein
MRCHVEKVKKHWVKVAKHNNYTAYIDADITH